MAIQQSNQLNPCIQQKFNEITSHCAWHADLTGIEAETLLRAKPAFTYLIRQGEKNDHFYLSFIRGGEFCHLPFTIDYSVMQWFYLNTSPHFADDLRIFIPEIMHKEESECFPLVPFSNTK